MTSLPSGLERQSALPTTTSPDRNGYSFINLIRNEYCHGIPAIREDWETIAALSHGPEHRLYLNAAVWSSSQSWQRLWRQWTGWIRHPWKTHIKITCGPSKTRAALEILIHINEVLCQDVLDGTGKVISFYTCKFSCPQKKKCDPRYRFVANSKHNNKAYRTLVLPIGNSPHIKHGL